MWAAYNLQVHCVAMKETQRSLSSHSVAPLKSDWLSLILPVELFVQVSQGLALTEDSGIDFALWSLDANNPVSCQQQWKSS